MDEEDFCPTCTGTGTCATCQAGTITDLATSCECAATHKCVDCHGTGTHDAYATEQMGRLREVFRRSGLPF